MVGMDPAVAVRAVPHAVLQEGLASGQVFFLKSRILLALELVVVEDVQRIRCGLRSLFLEGKQNIDRRLAYVLPLALDGGPDVAQAGDKPVHREAVRCLSHCRPPLQTLRL